MTDAGNNDTTASTRGLKSSVAATYNSLTSGLLMRGDVAVRPVQPKGREATRAPNGRPLMERDALGQFLINGDAYACLVGGVVLLGWALTRICRQVSTRHGELEEHDA